MVRARSVVFADGDISPSAESGLRSVALIMILLGIGLIFPLLSSGVEQLFVTVVTSKGRDFLEYLLPQTRVSLNVPRLASNLGRSRLLVLRLRAVADASRRS